MYAEYVTVRTDFREFFVVRVDRRLFDSWDNLDTTYRTVAKYFPGMEGAFIPYGVGSISEDAMIYASPDLRRLLIGETPSQLSWRPMEIDTRTQQVTRPNT